MVGDSVLQPCLLGLFNTLVPSVVDVDWRLDRAHFSLGLKPPAGARPRDAIVRFHFYDGKKAPHVINPRSHTKGAKLQPN